MEMSLRGIMNINCNVRMKMSTGICLAIFAAFFLVGCLSGSDGPAVTTVPQTISFSAAPVLNLGGTATVKATASSGLALTYSSMTPAICSVKSSTGLVTNITSGTCIIAANQAGNAGFFPAAEVSQSISVASTQSISFSAAPTLCLYCNATVTATASNGLAPSYSSNTPSVCSVNSSTGLVTDITTGDCIIAAHPSGNTTLQVTQTIAVAAWSGSVTVPGAPTAVTATTGSAANTVSVNAGEISSGGSPIAGYAVTSAPGGITATGTVLPMTVTCPITCSGYAFSMIASNAVGNSLPSTAAHVLTNYSVTETFYEPMTQPDDSIFTGTFTLDSTSGTVSNLIGSLTESMTGIPMATVVLGSQLSVVSDGAGGLLVTTFALNTTNTFYGGGFAPGSGSGMYFGYPGANNGNAYAMIYINVANPTATLTQAQLDKLAYADCTNLGMMGATCMTGTTVAGYGTIGTMSGYPVSQIISKR
jgi:hypothetical protein